MAVNSRTAVSGRRTRTWLIGVYIRLSKEDARHLDESESVTNQRFQAQQTTSEKIFSECSKI